MCYGPYTAAIPAGTYTATFFLMLDNVTADNLKILTLDVRDANSGAILAVKDIHRRDFSQPFTYKGFTLNFTAPANAKLEFRTLWHNFSYVRAHSVIVE